MFFHEKFYFCLTNDKRQCNKTINIFFHKINIEKYMKTIFDFDLIRQEKLFSLRNDFTFLSASHARENTIDGITEGV